MMRQSRTLDCVAQLVPFLLPFMNGCHVIFVDLKEGYAFDAGGTESHDLIKRKNLVVHRPLKACS